MKELGNISPKTLSDTLKILQAEGLIKKETFNEIPPRVEYSLTEDGKELRKVIIPLLEWAAKRNNVKKESYNTIYCKIPAHCIKKHHQQNDNQKT